MTLEQKRDLLPRIIDAVFVIKGNSHSRPDQRVIICPAGTGPRNLPRIGDRGATLRAITPRRGWINPTQG
jgi:hypothetical protein